MILNTIIIVVLIALAIFLLVLELFFLPGVTVAALFSIVFYSVAIYYAFAHISTTVGYITLVAALLLSVFIIWYFMRSRTLDKMSLHTNIDSTAPTQVSNAIRIGDEGITLSRFNPMGRVRIGNTITDARSFEFIDEGVAIVVTDIDSHAIYVEPNE